MKRSDRPRLASDLGVASPASATVPLERLAARESNLWWLALPVLVGLAMGLAVTSWQQIHALPWELDALPVGLVLLVCLFAIYALTKSRKIAELQGLIGGLEQQAALPDFARVQKVFQVVQRSQQGYRDLIDTFDELLFSISLDGEILAVSRSFADLLGRSFSEIVGRPLDQFIELANGNGRTAAQKALPGLRERRRWSGVLRIKMKHDASTRYFNCTVHVLARNGREQGLSILARDITQERENEARFTELFDALQEGVYLASADEKFENVNPALARLLGYQDREELLGHSLSEFFVETGEWETQQRQLSNSGVLQGRETVLRRRDGSAVTSLHAAAALRDAAGHIRRYQGSLMDISARLEVEKRLHREQQFARRLMESFPDLVLAVDREGRYTFVSPRAKELLGSSSEEMVGKPFADGIDAHDRKEVRAMMDSILSGQSASGSVEYRCETRSGEMRLFRATAGPLFDTPGKIEGVIASARDITESTRMEQQLIQSERLAAMGQMIAGVAHELNNPLTAVLGVTELLRESAAEDSTRRQLEIAHRQARRAAQIVQSLLTFSRPPQPRKTCVNLSDLIQRSLQLHEHSLRSNSITVDFIPKPSLPVILGDANQLTQVFLNLIANAEQAITEIRNHGTLRIRVGSLGDRVLATFQDDGAGIRREILPKIFDPFFTTKRPGRGTGLGLSICLAILREHHGGIEAQPLADGGSVFSVSLPIASGTSTFLAEPSQASAESAPTITDRLAGSSVLVVDDEESMRELVREGLAVRGVRVDVAETVEEALSLAQRRQYDAVVSDLNLGAGTVLSGRQLYAQVMGKDHSSNGAERPFFVFMTGELLDKAEDLVKQGARILQKPFRISDLIALLIEALAEAPSPTSPSSKVN